MAILKAINVKRAGRKKFLATLAYVSNPEKNKSEDTKDKALDFEINTFVNRYLHGKRDSKRQFKQFVVSMSTKWPGSLAECESYKRLLRNVLLSCEQYFMDQGFITSGWIHCNTAHPHFHIVLDTCNAITGKQYSKSKADLNTFKDFVNLQLTIHGLEEIIKTSTVNEDDLFIHEASDLRAEEHDEKEQEFTPDSDEENFSQIFSWNSGTSEHNDIIYTDEKPSLKTMVKIVQPTLKREMVKIVQSTPKREMVKIVQSTPKREMAKIIHPAEKIEMARIIHNESKYKREMVRIVCDNKLIEK